MQQSAQYITIHFSNTGRLKTLNQPSFEKAQTKKNRNITQRIKCNLTRRESNVLRERKINFSQEGKKNNNNTTRHTETNIANGNMLL